MRSGSDLRRLPIPPTGTVGTMPQLPLLNLVKPIAGLGLSITGAVLSRVPGPLGAVARDLRAGSERPEVILPPSGPHAPVGAAASRTPGTTASARQRPAAPSSARKRPARVNAEKPAPPIAEATPAELAELGEGRQPAPFGSTTSGGS